MRVLVTWGTKRGGTEGIGRIVGEELSRRGFDVTAAPAERVTDVGSFDAAIIGGALYANRWNARAKRLVDRNVGHLRRIPVWLFASGPLDDSADRKLLAPVPQVAVRADRIGACGQVTFGGRLAPDAKGFPASSMAKLVGDWRNPERIRAWAADVARALPAAQPRAAADPPARSIPRLIAFGAGGWAACALIMTALMMKVASTGVMVAMHAVAAPLIFAVVAALYFRGRGAREPLPTAAAFTATIALLDLAVVAGLIEGTLDRFTSFAMTWLPFALIFATTWAVGELMSTMPWSNFADAAKANEAAKASTHKKTPPPSGAAGAGHDDHRNVALGSV